MRKTKERVSAGVVALRTSSSWLTALKP